MPVRQPNPCPAVLLPVAFAVMALVPAAVHGQGEGKPNFLLLLADDMTYTDMGAYGNPDVRTPNLDRLVRDGMRFRYFFNSAPMCAPTRMSLYSGIHPVRNGAYPNHSRVYEGIRSLPHYLRPLGYDVALIGKKHYAPEANFPFGHLGGREHDSGEDGPDLDVDEAVRFFTERPNRPWMLVVANNQPHSPWNRGDPSVYHSRELSLPPYFVDTPETRETLAQYYAEITYMDGMFGRILDGLKRSGMAADTVVVFLSEQGSSFPHCKWTCYDTGLRSAAAIRWPGRIRAGSVSDALVQYVDVLPTVVELAGGTISDLEIDGRSFAAVLRGERATHNDYVFGLQTTRGIYSGSDAYGIRTARDRRYRLISNLNWESEFQNLVTERFEPYLSWARLGKTDPFAREQAQRYRVRPRYELYDLEADPYEMHNLAEAPRMHRAFARLQARLERWMAQQGDRGPETEAAAKQRQPNPGLTER